MLSENFIKFLMAYQKDDFKSAKQPTNIMLRGSCGKRNAPVKIIIAGRR